MLTLSGREGILSLTLKKSKETEGGKVIHLKLEQVSLDESGLTSCVITPLTADSAGVKWSDRIHVHLDAVADIGSTTAELLKALKVDDSDRSSFYRGLNQLRDSGDVRSEGPRGRKRHWLIDHYPTADEDRK